MTIPVTSRTYASSGNSTGIPQKFFTNRAPGVTDINGPGGQWPEGQEWIDQTLKDTWQLISYSSTNAQVTAFWQRTASGAGGAIYTITGDSGTPVASDSNGNMSLVGDGRIAFSGSGTTLTATITGGGILWNDVTAASQTLSANNGYVVDNAGSLVTFTIPSTAAIGDTYIIQGKTSLGWRVNVATGQTLHMGSKATTTSTGYIAFTNQWDSVTITCVTANTTFSCRGVQGDITVV